MSFSEEKRSFGSHRKMMQQILHYLIEHPDAKDTIEGILKWWFPKNHVERQIEVREALNVLVSKEWLTERELTPSPKIYGLNKDHLKEIKGFLHELESKVEKKNV